MNNAVKEFALAQVGKKFAAMGVDMVNLINACGGTAKHGKPVNRLNASTIKGMGIDVAQDGFADFKTRNVTFRVFHKSMDRDMFNNAHMMFIAGVYDEHGNIYGGKAQMVQRVLQYRGKVKAAEIKEHNAFVAEIKDLI